MHILALKMITLNSSYGLSKIRLIMGPHIISLANNFMFVEVVISHLRLLNEIVGVDHIGRIHTYFDGGISDLLSILHSLKHHSSKHSGEVEPCLF